MDVLGWVEVGCGITMAPWCLMRTSSETASPPLCFAEQPGPYRLAVTDLPTESLTDGEG